MIWRACNQPTRLRTTPRIIGYPDSFALWCFFDAPRCATRSSPLHQLLDPLIPILFSSIHTPLSSFSLTPFTRSPRSQLTDHICGDTNARLSPNGGGFTATILFVYPVTPLPAPTPSQPNLGGSSDEYLIIRARVINAEGRRSLTYGSAELMHPDGPHQPSSQVGCKCIGLFVGPKGGGYGGSAWRGVKL